MAGKDSILYFLWAQLFYKSVWVETCTLVTCDQHTFYFAYILSSTLPNAQIIYSLTNGSGQNANVTKLIIKGNTVDYETKYDIAKKKYISVLDDYKSKRQIEDI